MRMFGSRREHEDLEARLRLERPEPSAELLSSVEARISGLDAVPRPHSRLRYGLAAGFAASLAVVFAAFGGFGTFSTPTASSSVTVAVPSSALPTIKALQARGAILAASPASFTKSALKAGKVKGIVLKTGSPDIKAAISKASTKPTDTLSGLKLAPADKSVRTSLVPNVGGGGIVRQLSATVVYVPGVFIPVCWPDGFGNYYNLLVPLAQIGSFVPPGTYGFCPSV